MSSLNETKLAQLMCSRLCHDIIAPVGALSLGVDMLQEKQGIYGAETVDLLVDTQKKLAAALKYYRAAFGAAYSAKPLSVQEAEQLVLDFAESKKVTVHWQFSSQFPVHLENKNGSQNRIVLLLALLAMESLPNGGELLVGSHQASAASGDTLNTYPYLKAVGRPVAIQEDVLRSVHDSYLSLEELTPKTAPIYLLQSLSKDIAGAPQIQLSPEKNTLELKVMPLSAQEKVS